MEAESVFQLQLKYVCVCHVLYFIHSSNCIFMGSVSVKKTEINVEMLNIIDYAYRATGFLELWFGLRLCCSARNIKPSEQNRCTLSVAHRSIPKETLEDDRSLAALLLMKTMQNVFGPEGRCAVETVDEPEAVSDTSLPDLGGPLGSTAGSQSCNQCHMLHGVN